MAGVAAAVTVSEAQVLDFVSALLSGSGAAAAPAGDVGPDENWARSVTVVPRCQGSSDGTPPPPALALHPRVDALHPLGTAHSAEQLLDALRLYKQLVRGCQLEVAEVLVAGDKAIVTGHQLVDSHAAALLASVLPQMLAEQPQQQPQETPEAATMPSSRPAPDAASTIPGPAAAVAGQAEAAHHQQADSGLAQRLAAVPLLGPALHAAEALLPSVQAARVPTTIQLRFGKNDAGAPVVTQMSLTFSLVASLLPHLALQPWQQQLLDQVQPQLLQAMMAAGSLASVAEDAGTSLAATWRASAAVLSATVGRVLGEVRGRVQGAAAAGVQSMAARAGMDGGGGGGSAAAAQSSG